MKMILNIDLTFINLTLKNVISSVITTQTNKKRPCVWNSKQLRQRWSLKGHKIPIYGEYTTDKNKFPLTSDQPKWIYSLNFTHNVQINSIQKNVLFNVLKLKVHCVIFNDIWWLFCIAAVVVWSLFSFFYFVFCRFLFHSQMVWSCNAIFF